MLTGSDLLIAQHGILTSVMRYRPIQRAIGWLANCNERGEILSQVVTGIDGRRKARNLSSGVRVLFLSTTRVDLVSEAFEQREIPVQ